MPFAERRPKPLLRTGIYWLSAILISVAGFAHPENNEKTSQPPARELPNRFPEKPSIAPSWSIPVEPLGFAAPGENYLGSRNSMASLDFLGEDRLLFTFRVPGLMKREPGNSSEDQRQIRAVVLTLPSGAIQSQTDWTVHDRSSYLARADDDHFLLRDRDVIYQGDSSLNRQPILRYPGPLVSVHLSPGGQFIVTNSQEAAKSASASSESDQKQAKPESDDADQTKTVLRILKRDTHQVVFVTNVRNPVDLPVNNDGILTALRGNGPDWDISLTYFSGQNRTIGKVKSVCAPGLDFLSQELALATACSDGGDNALVALTTAGATLWTDLVSDRLVWPLIAAAPNGLRFARETLFISHSINAFAPLGTEDIKGQWIRVFDSATGNVVFESPATPILDAGGNIALSPSGRRVAVLHAGSIQVFELPAPPPLPSAEVVRPARE